VKNVIGSRSSLQITVIRRRYLLFFFLLLFPALLNAMATACFCGLPAFISVLMFELTVLREEPVLRGIAKTSKEMHFHLNSPRELEVPLTRRVCGIRVKFLNTRKKQMAPMWVPLEPSANRDLSLPTSRRYFFPCSLA
jgi:hypothetical protein